MAFILQPQSGGVHSIRPDHDTTLPGIDRSKAQVLALIDLSVIDPALAGRKVPFVSYFVSESLRLRDAGDGSWVQDTEHGDTLEWAEPFEGGPGQFDGITPAAGAILTESEQRSADVSFQLGGQPRWVQGDEAPGEPYIFVGQMESRYSNATIYAFYHPDKREIMFECQFT
jgi:hypothetical protein